MEEELDKIIEVKEEERGAEQKKSPDDDVDISKAFNFGKES